MTACRDKLLYSPVKYRYNLQPFGGIAQLGERLHGMQEVSGSIPLTSTTIHSGTFPTVPDQSETGRQYNGLIEKSFLVFPACSRWSLCHLLVCLLVHGIFLESTLKMYQQISAAVSPGKCIASNLYSAGCPPLCIGQFSTGAHWVFC